ncbi:MAG TPA: hypothetical protein O0X18_09115 [Methanocorpusculum sp.]|nr:hypothetical protein [Methanocorpusculum sp.]
MNCTVTNGKSFDFPKIDLQCLGTNTESCFDEEDIQTKGGKTTAAGLPRFCGRIHAIRTVILHQLTHAARSNAVKITNQLRQKK